MGDLGVGLPLEHCLRACYVGLHIAADLKLDTASREDVFWALLLKDAGCTSFTTQAAAFFRGDEIAARREMLFYTDPNSMRDVMDWALTYLGPDTGPWTRAGRVLGFLANGRDFVREGFTSSIEVAQRIATRLEMCPSVGSTLAALFERWDGKGMPLGLRGEAIPIAARVAYASTYFEVFSRLGGADAARHVGIARAGSAFDGAVVDAFLRVSTIPGFWPPLASESILQTVLALKPGEPPALAGEVAFDAMALAFADFVDMKSHYLAGHSRRVAGLATGIGRRLHLPAAELASLNRAALMHDVGFVAVPSFSVNKPPEERFVPCANAGCLVTLYLAQLSRRRNHMARYLIERNIPNAGSMGQEWLKTISQKSNSVLHDLNSDGKRVQWEHSYVTDNAIYCVYLASDPEVVLEHARCGGFPADRIMQVPDVIDPTTGE